jgi:hypothetical protein
MGKQLATPPAQQQAAIAVPDAGELCWKVIKLLKACYAHQFATHTQKIIECPSPSRVRQIPLRLHKNVFY